MRDFEPIIIGATSPEVLVVHPSVPAKTVQELVALVRAGKYNNFAIAGAGTPPHLSTELFKLSLKLASKQGGYWASPLLTSGAPRRKLPGR